jgi:hypothetical protein
VNKSAVTTEIVPLSANDKSIMLRFLWFIYKIFSGLLLLLFIMLCFIADFKTKATQQVLLFGWLPSAILVNLGFFIWYLFVANQFRYPYKMVVNGVVVDTFVWNGKYPEFNVFLGEKKEEFKLMRAYDWPNKTVEINDHIALHYILKSQDKLGSLIKVEKLNPL